MRHVTSLSTVPSLDCAYFLSPQGCTGPKSQKPPLFSLRARCLPAAPALCFHILTNPLAGNPFIFTSMQTPGGVGWSVLVRKWRQSPKLRSTLASATIQIRQFPCSIPQGLRLVSAHQGPRESGGSTGHKLNAPNPRVPPVLTASAARPKILPGSPPACSIKGDTMAWLAVTSDRISSEAAARYLLALRVALLALVAPWALDPVLGGFHPYLTPFSALTA